jgi:hypothetical protein
MEGGVMDPTAYEVTFQFTAPHPGVDKTARYRALSAWAMRVLVAATDDPELAFVVDCGAREPTHAPRHFDGYECGHMRQLIRVDGKWHHIASYGQLGPECGASSRYRVASTYSGEHTISSAVREA